MNHQTVALESLILKDTQISYQEYVYIYINKYVCIHIHHLSNSNKHILLTSGGVIILVVTITWECGTTQGKQLQQNPDLTFHEMLVDS